jgi:hypothetical protein
MSDQSKNPIDGLSGEFVRHYMPEVGKQSRTRVILGQWAISRRHKQSFFGLFWYDDDGVPENQPFRIFHHIDAAENAMKWLNCGLSPVDVLEAGK